MPRDKDLKRIVRARMKKTGESYTTARASITRKPAGKKSRSGDATAPDTGVAAAQPSGTVLDDVATIAATGLPKEAGDDVAVEQPAAPQAPDHAAVAGMSDAKIAEKTGRTWGQWVEELDRAGMAQSEHGAIARLLYEHYHVDGWWAQMLTVGYERIKGLRERGQRRSGSYEVNKSKTVNVPVDVLFDACADDDTRGRWLPAAGEKVTTMSKPRSLRMRWPDGTLVGLWFDSRGPAKSTVGVQHTKLPDRATADELKTYWAERLNALAGVLRGS